jgi:hypothetical protein
MKKIIAGLVLLTSLVIQLHAETPLLNLNSPDLLEEKLMEAFPDATHITWERNGDLHVARFNTTNDRMTAYFTDDAELYKVTRFVECKHLPLTVQRSLNETYDLAKKEKTIMEVTKGTDTYYLISFESDNRQFIIESDMSGNLQVIRKTKL